MKIDVRVEIVNGSKEVGKEEACWMHDVDPSQTFQ